MARYKAPDLAPDSSYTTLARAGRRRHDQRHRTHGARLLLVPFPVLLDCLGRSGGDVVGEARCLGVESQQTLWSGKRKTTIACVWWRGTGMEQNRVSLGGIVSAPRQQTKMGPTSISGGSLEMFLYDMACCFMLINTSISSITVNNKYIRSFECGRQK